VAVGGRGDLASTQAQRSRAERASFDFIRELQSYGCPDKGNSGAERRRTSSGQVVVKSMTAEAWIRKLNAFEDEGPGERCRVELGGASGAPPIPSLSAGVNPHFARSGGVCFATRGALLWRRTPPAAVRRSRARVEKL